MADTSTVISILPVGIDESKPGLIPSQYILPGVLNPREDVNVLVVARAKFPVYLDENRPSLIVPAPSDVVAESICQDYKLSVSQYEVGQSEPGLFWATGIYTPETVKTKLTEELARARELQIEWFKRLVNAADDDWVKFRVRRAISPIQRLACNILKLEREWNVDSEVTSNLALKTCKFCFADVHPSAIVCSHCQGILDPVRYTTEFRKAG